MSGMYYIFVSKSGPRWCKNTLWYSNIAEQWQVFSTKIWKQPPMKRAVVAAAASIFVYPARTSFLAFSYIPTIFSALLLCPFLQSCRYYDLHTIVVLEHTYSRERYIHSKGKESWEIKIDFSRIRRCIIMWNQLGTSSLYNNRKITNYYVCFFLYVVD